ncbi:MAG: hypothetical protein V1784_07675 [bacterium]
MKRFACIVCCLLILGASSSVAAPPLQFGISGVVIFDAATIDTTILIVPGKQDSGKCDVKPAEKHRGYIQYPVLLAAGENGEAYAAVYANLPPTYDANLVGRLNPSEPPFIPLDTLRSYGFNPTDVFPDGRGGIFAFEGRRLGKPGRGQYTGFIRHFPREKSAAEYDVYRPRESALMLLKYATLIAHRRGWIASVFSRDEGDKEYLVLQCRKLRSPYTVEIPITGPVPPVEAHPHGASSFKADRKGNLFVLWQEWNETTLNPGRFPRMGRSSAPLRIAKFTARGKPCWQGQYRTVTETVPVNFSDWQTCVPDNRGGVYVTWSAPCDTAKCVLLQAFDKKGQARWENPLVIAKGTNLANVQALSDEKGGIVVVWIDWGEVGASLKMQRMDSRGELLLGNEGMALTPFFRDLTRISRPEPDGKGGFYITWLNAKDKSNQLLQGIHMNCDGTRPENYWDPISEPLYEGGKDIEYQSWNIAADGKGGCWFGWVEEGRRAKANHILAE